MSFFTDAFHKITKKTASPRIVWRSSYVVFDSKTGAHRLQGQFIQPQVGMYSVLTIGEHVDVVVRYERLLPYILPVSSDEECPQLTYVMPRQDMKAGDFFTLFVEREHFLVEVVQVLPKSSDSSHDSDRFLHSSSKPDKSRTRWEPVQSSLNIHSESLSPDTGHSQDKDVPITTTKSPQRTPKPVTRPLSACSVRRDETIFTTKTEVDGGRTRKPARTFAPVSPVTAVFEDLPDRGSHNIVDPDPTPQESRARTSDQVHQTNSSDNHIVSLQVDINLNLKGAPRSPSGNSQISRGLDGPLPPTPPNPTMDPSKTTRENPKVRIRKRSTTGRNSTQVPKESAIFNNSNDLQVPLTTQVAYVQPEHTLQEYLSFTSKKTHGTKQEPFQFDPPLRELHNIGKGFETVTMEDSMKSTSVSIHSCLSDVTRTRTSVSRKSSQRTKTRAPLAGHCQFDIQEVVPANWEEDYELYRLVPKHIRTSQHDLDRVYIRTPKRG